ncbi:MAG TPA: type II toxin-antitoxin system CcdA family antitoxin [Candidatus Methanomethylicus sp.]|nr:type II toxin-antitoxin system CcdA family antitoxin [Candidatus Methanomethylicus sp.]
MTPSAVTSVRVSVDRLQRAKELNLNLSQLLEAAIDQAIAIGPNPIKTSFSMQKVFERKYELAKEGARYKNLGLPEYDEWCKKKANQYGVPVGAFKNAIDGHVDHWLSVGGF